MNIKLPKLIEHQFLLLKLRFETLLEETRHILSTYSDKKEIHQFDIQDHINKDVHEKIMQKLKEATPKEVLESSIRAGIHDENGNLTEKYRD